MDLGQWMSVDAAKQWLATEGLSFATRLVAFALIVFAGWLVARAAGGIVKAALHRSKAEPSPLLEGFILSVVRKSILILAILAGLDTLGMDTTAIIAGLGASGLVLGFALKDTLSNFASGFLLLMYRPFDVGQYVQVSGIEGAVKDMNLVSTVLTTGDNKVITIPNAKVWGQAITNYSAADTRRIDLVVGIGYDDDIDKALRLLDEIVRGHDKVLDDPALVIRVKELADSSVNFDVRPWVATGDYWPVRAELLETIKKRFDAEGVGIPFPQREVWLHQVEASA